MFCITCGKENADDAEYCLGCGRKLERTFQRSLTGSEDTIDETLLRQGWNVPQNAKKSKKLSYVLMIACGVVILAVAVMLFWPVYGPWSEWELSERPSEVGLQKEAAKEYRFRELERVETTSPDLFVGGEPSDQYEKLSDFGQWSEWQNEPVTETEHCEVETTIQYRSRTVTVTTEYSEWGDWGAWSETKVESSEITQVKTRTVYRYSGFGYFCNSCGYCYDKIDLRMVVHARMAGLDSQILPLREYIAGVENSSASKALESANFVAKAKYLDGIGQPLTVDTSSGPPYAISYNGQTWYTNSSEPEVITQYCTRTRTQETVETCSEWSEYTDQELKESDTVEVERTQRYRYRTREVVTVYVYDIWGEWSPWQKEALTASERREVQEQTKYRYRQKYTLLEYLMK